MPTVLITGASRGIGLATAAWLAARDWDVFAGVRSSEDGHPDVRSLQRFEVRPRGDAVTIERALTDRRPKARYVAGW